jgi:hypothetical protein
VRLVLLHTLFYIFQIYQCHFFFSVLFERMLFLSTYAVIRITSFYYVFFSLICLFSLKYVNIHTSYILSFIQPNIPPSILINHNRRSWGVWSVGRNVPGNYDTVDSERILYGGCYVDIHDRELVQGVLAISRTSVVQEEHLRKAAQPLSAAQLTRSQLARSRGLARARALAQARAPGLAQA